MDLFTLPRIFNKSIFRIPDYQRGYSWEKKQLEELWNDIFNIDRSKNRVHYTGLITVKRVEEEISSSWHVDTPILRHGAYTPFYVVDGQQRLTTIIILLNVIFKKAMELEKENESKALFFLQKGADEEIQKVYLYEKTRGSNPVISYFFGYSVDDPSNEHLKTQIFGLPSSKSHNESKTTYTNNLDNAHEFFTSQIASKVNKAKKSEQMKVIEDIYTKIATGLVFGFLDINNRDNIDIHVTFETMNNRGKFLSKLELLKNRLIYLSTLLDVDNDKRNKLRRDINEAWKTIYTFLGKSKDRKALPDDDFLKNHYIIFFKGKTKIEEFDSFLLEKYFVPARINNTEPAECLDYDDISHYVKSIQECVIPWFYMHDPLYEKNNKLSENSKSTLLKLNRLTMTNFKPVILAALTKESKPEVIENLLSKIEIYIFGINHFSKSPTKGKTFSYDLAQSIYLEDFSLTKATSNISTLYKNSIDTDDFIKFLEKSLVNRDEKGWYSWDKLQYFLFEYEEHIRSTEGKGGRAKLGWEETIGDSIEHIFPQKPQDGSWESFDNLENSLQARISNSLGNLLLIPAIRNSSLGNSSFAVKRKAYKTGTYCENVIAKEVEWTPLIIHNRGKQMLDFLSKRWLIKFTQKQIQELLLFHVKVL